MKKIASVIVFLVLLFCVVTMTGCKDKGMTLTVRNFGLSLEESKKLDSCLNEYIEAFKDHYGKEVDIEIEYVKDIPADISSTDVIIMPVDTSLEYIISDTADLTQYIPKDLELLESAMALGDCGSGQRLIPFNYDRAVIYADKEEFAAAGLELPDKDWTYPELLNLIDTLAYTDDQEINHVALYAPIYKNYVWRYFIEARGAKWYDESTGYITMGEDTEGYKAFYDMLSNYSSRKIQSYGFNHAASWKAQCAMSLTYACQPDANGLYNQSIAQKKLNPGTNASTLMEEDRLVMLPLPSGTEGTNAGYANTDFIMGMAVSSGSDNMDAAGAMAAFSLTEEGQKILNSYYGGIPVNKALWTEDFWKKGYLSGENADTVLIGIENDKRDDYAMLFSDDPLIYHKNIRLRTVFSNLFMGKGDGIDYENSWATFSNIVKQVINSTTTSNSLQTSEFSATSSKAALRDNYTDTWVATDALGRELPTNDQTGDPKERYVGIFYFLFLNAKSGTIIDHSKIYLNGGVEAVWESLVLSGMHFWGEPYFGYYSNTDRWVYRKHAQMLSDAGVDFVYLDVTNSGGFFQHAWTALMEEWSLMRSEGNMTPQVIFHCGDVTGTMYEHVEMLWDSVYRDGKYKELWFYWEGKPLILGNPLLLSKEYTDFFTIRKSWAFNSWTSEGSGEERWPWIAEYPQVPGRNKDGEIEQVAVASGFHSNSSKGRSYVNNTLASNGKVDFGFSLDTTDQGLAFAEQWKQALKIDPPLVMITGWNEFTMGRWENAGPGQIMSNTYQITVEDLQFEYNYIDCFNVEYSRDIEPINGFFGDNYYYQMTDYIRQYKGTREIPEACGMTDIDMKDISSAEQGFSNVGPIFYDTVDDIMHRDHASVTGTYHYLNETGRNDIDMAKVSKTKGNVYFYVKCTDDIIFDDGLNWMNLFIDSDCDHATGWNGYDYIINRTRNIEGGKGTVSIEKFVDGEWKFETIGEGECIIEGDTLVIKVADSAIGLSDHNTFDFKWADNSTLDGNVMEFMDLGDAAPNSRFNFRYLDRSENRAGYFTTKSIIVLGCAGAVILLGIVAILVIKKKTIPA